MGRVETFIGIGIAVAVAIFARRLAIDLLSPGAPLFLLVENVQYAGIDGDQWAREVYEMVAVYVPWLLVGGSIVIGAYREFLGQNVTQRRARR
jgi:hypothetical protein